METEFLSDRSEEQKIARRTKTNVLRLIKDYLLVGKASTRWIPKILLAAQKEEPICCFKECLHEINGD